MKKILLLIESLGSGGAERQLTGLAVMLKKQGYCVQVCYYVKMEFYLPFLQENGVESIYFEDANSTWKRVVQIRNYIRAYKPDTVISYSAFPSMITCMLKIFGYKFNLIVSERSTTQVLDNRERIRFFLYRWANHIVPNSHSQREFIGGYFKNLIPKTTVITNFIDTDRFTPKRSNKTHDEELRMICVGRIGQEKNILTFIDAIKNLCDSGCKVRVDWYGQDYNDDYSEKCHNAVESNKLEDFFIFQGSSHTIEDQYSNADVFCLPSLYEGFPNVLCEAMSCGLPILCSNVCDNPRIVKEGVNGFLFNQLDPHDISKVIKSFIQLPIEQKERMRNVNREEAVVKFSKKTFLKKYISIIEKQ